MLKISVKGHPAVMQEGDTDHHHSAKQQDSGLDDLTLNQLSAKGSQQRDDHRSRGKNKSGVDRSISEKGLQDLRNHCGGSEQSDSEDEVEDIRNCKVPDLQKPQVDDRFWSVQFPIHSGTETHDCYNETAAYG